MQLVDSGAQQRLYIVGEVAEGLHVFGAHLGVVDHRRAGKASLLNHSGTRYPLADSGRRLARMGGEQFLLAQPGHFDVDVPAGRGWDGLFLLDISARCFANRCRGEPCRRGNRRGRGSLLSCHIELKAKKPLSPDYPLELKTLGDHLRKKRLDSGLLQKEVAALLGVSEFSILSWEKNRAEPAYRHIPRIIAFLGYLPSSGILEKPLGDKILRYRQLRGINQEALALEIGVDPGTLARWEKGKGCASEAITTLVDQFLRACVSMKSFLACGMI